MAGATVVGDPLHKGVAVQIDAMAVHAAVGPVKGHIAALWVAVGMLGTVGADDTGPALGVSAREQQTLLRQPSQHVIVAIVSEPNRAGATRLGRAGRHVQGGADVGQHELAVGVELSQNRTPFGLVRLEVDATG